MERRKGARRPIVTRRGLSKLAPATIATEPFPILEDFVLHGEGHLSIGEVGPFACAADASDPRAMFATLQRRVGEPLMQLLQRPEAALSRALDHDEYTDEING